MVPRLGGIAHCRPGRRSFATTWRGLLAPAMHAGACIPCAPPRRLKATSVISRDCMHLLRCQLPRDRAHLLADVVLAHALSEGQQLAFDTVTGGAWRDAACGRLDGYTRVRQIPERAQEGRDAARPSAASWQIGSGSIGGLHCSTSVVDRRTRLAVSSVAFAVPEEGLVDVNNNRVLDVDQVIEPIAELDALVGFRGGRFFTSLKSPS